jgi:hypothetical protein
VWTTGIGDIITKTEARKLLKQKATTRLKVVDVSLLHHLINAVFLGQGEGAKSQDLASRTANISVQTLAAKCGLKTEKTVCQHLRKLGAEKLITIGPHPQNQNKHVYTVHLEPMVEWESAATVATKQKKERLEARRVAGRTAYAIKKGEAIATTALPESKESRVVLPPATKPTAPAGESEHRLNAK